MIAQRGQKSLVDCASDELVCEVIAVEHVDKRVRLAFRPELVARRDVGCDFIGTAFRCADDDAVVVWARDWADTVAELAGEKVVPGFVAVVRRGRVADVVCGEGGW